jgi:hypothetical protein
VIGCCRALGLQWRYHEIDLVAVRGLAGLGRRGVCCSGTARQSRWRRTRRPPAGAAIWSSNRAERARQFCAPEVLSEGRLGLSDLLQGSDGARRCGRMAFELRLCVDSKLGCGKPEAGGIHALHAETRQVLLVLNSTFSRLPPGRKAWAITAQSYLTNLHCLLTTQFTEAVQSLP